MLAVKIRLPIVHMDQLLWQSGWVQTNRTALDEKIALAVAQPYWIMEGMFARTLPQRLGRADTVIWLDVGRLTSLARVVRRTLWHYGRTRPDMTPGCPERFDLEFFRYIWSFQTDERPVIIGALDQCGRHARIVRLRSPRDVNLFLSSIS
jgi:adenylate kinase family enzyme